MDFVISGGEERFRVVGIDENAYGPILGPMTVTGVLLDVPEPPFIYLDLNQLNPPKGLRDSKKVFTRSESSYSLGEIVALSLITSAGGEVTNFRELLEFVSDTSRLKESELISALDLELHLPLWAKHIDPSPITHWFETMEIEVKDIRVDIVTAKEFNELLKSSGSKSTLDFWKFMDVMSALPDFDLAMCGKLGGTRYYGRLFEGIGVNVTAIQETRGISSYRVADGREIHFILNGDERFLPIAMASIVGKYVREVFMFLMNKLVGHDEPVPWASGYRHDAKTYQLMEELSQRFPKEEVVRER